LVQIGAAADWQAVAAGQHHTVALKQDGTLWAWGQNSYGQLGDGTTAQRNSPVQIGIAADWQAVATGYSHNVAIKQDGTLWGWGYNGNGQLGDGTTVSKSSPVQIGIAADWQAVSAGAYYTVVLKQDSTLWAWGMNNYGQLGDGTTTQRNSPVQIGTATWQAVAAGDYHAVAVKQDGSLWAWGQNLSGQLGDGTMASKRSPVQIGIAPWQAVAAGYVQTVAVQQDGTLWAWGLNNYGQVGDGTTTQRSSPVQIGTDADWQAVASGTFHTVALKQDGTLYAWGSNWSGRLGDGTETDRLSPVQILPPIDPTAWLVTPSAGTGGTISPDSPQAVSQGATASFTVLADSGYRVETVEGCGGTLSGNTYTTAPVTEDCAVTASFMPHPSRNGMTWGVNKYIADLDITRVHCYGQVGPNRGPCDPYQGDTSCSAALPLLCVKVDGSPRPPYALIPCPSCAMSDEYYNGWAEGSIGLTAPAQGNAFASLADADAYCAAQLGEGYKVAEHHSGRYVYGMDENNFYGDTWPANTSAGGWGLYAPGQLADTSRFWVDINDQDANCWDRDPSNRYSVTPSAGTGGSINPDTPQSVEYGQTTSFTVTPETGYSIDKVEGCSGTLSGSTYTTGAITADCAVTAAFRKTDSDNDGVADSSDSCPNTAPGTAVDETGCSISQLVPCQGPKGTTTSWNNKGQYVSTVAKSAENFLAAGLITQTEKDAIVSAAAQSTCGGKK
jgi:hypothetical protein